MKFIFFLLLIFLPIVFSIDQISDDQTQPATTTADTQEAPPAETSQTSQAETKDAKDSTQTPPQPAESTTPQSDPQPAETAPQTTSQSDPQPVETALTPQETQPAAQTSAENDEKSTTPATPVPSATPTTSAPAAQTPSPISDEAPKSTSTPKTKPAQQNSQVYVTADDNSSYKGLCLSGGVCKDDVCICPPGFSGERCELVFDANESQYQKKMDSVVTKYYFAMVGLLGLVAVMVLSEFCFKGGSENPPKEDIPIDQGQKYVDLDLEAGPVADKNHADVEADVVPVQAEEPVQNYDEPEHHYVEPEEEKNYQHEVQPPVEEQNYAEPEFVPVEEPQHYVEPEVVVQEE